MELMELQEQFIEQLDTAREAMENISGLDEVQVATTPKELVWSDGKVELYHFFNPIKPKCKTPVLITYALVNKWHMMDLQPDRSFIKRLIAEGIDVYLIDWGYPTAADKYKTLEDYIQGNMDEAVNFIFREHQIDKINLLGVCQGGTFAIIYAALYPEKVKNLVTLVTPVDFDTDEGLLFKWARDMDVDAMVDGFGGIVPGDFLNSGFDLIKPLNKARKYVGFPDVMKDKDKLLNFLRMEKWVSDSPAQAGETFRKFIKDFYQENKLVKNKVKMNGQTVNLKKIDMPVLNIYAKTDHIVPPSSTKPLEKYVGSKDVETMEFPGGHIGVFVGSRSQQVLTPAIANWLIDRD